MKNVSSNNSRIIFSPKIINQENIHILITQAIHNQIYRLFDIGRSQLLFRSEFHFESLKNSQGSHLVHLTRYEFSLECRLEKQINYISPVHVLLSRFYPNFIQILFKFYPDFIKIFFRNSLYPDFILKIEKKSG